MKTFIEEITSTCASFYHIYFLPVTNYDNKQDNIIATCFKMQYSQCDIYLIIKESTLSNDVELHLYNGDSVIFVQKGNKKEHGIYDLASNICNKITPILKQKDSF